MIKGQVSGADGNCLRGSEERKALPGTALGTERVGQLADSEPGAWVQSPNYALTE